jgi:hypothetical protein
VIPEAFFPGYARDYGQDLEVVVDDTPRVYQCAECGNIKETRPSEKLDYRLHRGETVMTPKHPRQLLNDYVAVASVCPDCSKKQNKKQKAAAKR